MSSTAAGDRGWLWGMARLAERHGSDVAGYRDAMWLTVAPAWVSVGGVPVWRGYDPAPLPAEDDMECGRCGGLLCAGCTRADGRNALHAGETAFCESHASHGGLDRCSCGGVACADCSAHYPESFASELPHTWHGAL